MRWWLASKFLLLAFKLDHRYVGGVAVMLAPLYRPLYEAKAKTGNRKGQPLGGPENAIVRR